MRVCHVSEVATFAHLAPTKGRIKGGLFSWLQSATSPSDAIKSSSLDLLIPFSFSVWFTNNNSSLPQETLFFKRLVTCLGFISVTLMYCDVTNHLHYLRLAAFLAHQDWFSTAALLLFCSAGLGMWEPTNQRRLDIREGGLQEAGAKTGRGGIQSWTSGQYEEVTLLHCSMFSTGNPR